MEVERPLESRSVRELEALQIAVRKALEARRIQRAQEIREELEKRVAEEGLSLETVMGQGKRVRRARAATRYQNPQNPEETWAGRGRKPKWLVDALKGGASLGDFAL